MTTAELHEILDEIYLNIWKEITMKEHIDEITKVLIDYTKKNHIMASHVILADYAKALYNAGYRKQSVWEWKENLHPIYGDVEVEFVCSVCGIATDDYTDYCPNCGAKMKGGAE